MQLLNVTAAFYFRIMEAKMIVSVCICSLGHEQIMRLCGVFSCVCAGVYLCLRECLPVFAWVFTSVCVGVY